MRKKPGPQKETKPGQPARLLDMASYRNQEQFLAHIFHYLQAQPPGFSPPRRHLPWEEPGYLRIISRLNNSRVLDPELFPFVHFCRRFDLNDVQQYLTLHLLWKVFDKNAAEAQGGARPTAGGVCTSLRLWPRLCLETEPDSVLGKARLIEQKDDQLVLSRKAIRMILGRAPLCERFLPGELDEPVDGMMEPPSGATEARKGQEPEAEILQWSKPDAKVTDLVLPPDVRAALRVALNPDAGIALERWGLGNAAAQARKFLFYGAPGTGKTLAATVIAASSELELAFVKYAAVVGKFIGESEKNISRIFKEAAARPCVLLFDEADALLTSRFAQANHSADAGHNRSVNILLQEIENYPGIVVFTTNLAPALDPALERRIPVRLEFPLPEPQFAAEIYRKHIPTSMPVGPVDFVKLAAEFPLSGGMIKNAVLDAAKNAIGRGADMVEETDFRNALAKKANGHRRKKPIGFQMMEPQT